MNLYVISNINLDSFKDELLSTKIDNVSFAGYNQYINELIDVNSNLNKKKYDLVFFHLDGDQLFKFSIENDEFIYDDDTFIYFINSLSKFLAENSNTNIIISGINISSITSYNNLDSFVKNSFFEIQFSTNKKIKELSRKYTNLHYFDFPSIVSKFGETQLIDYKFWYLGRIKYSHFGMKIISNYFTSLINGIFGSTKKVLVLDLDNTLWGGVIGEDGLDGIELSEDGIGKIFRDFQNEILKLKSLGILLAICSKNNSSDVDEVFENHKMMLLKSDDFTVKKINWQNKSNNIREIASELNLGLDSIVFIDDNPVEREFVKKSIPEVNVPDFPVEIFNLKDWFINDVIYRYFSKISISNEDVNKKSQYERNIKRVKEKDISLSLEDYLKGLKMKIKLTLDDRNSIPRLSQLTQKTNQFNLSTIRYSENEIENLMNDKNKFVFSSVYEDKFGNEGIISVLIAEIINKKEVFIDTFLMSCRVIGRKVETKILKEVLERLEEEHEIKSVKMNFNATKKNILAKKFYDECGFTESTKNIEINNLISKLNET